MELSTAQFWTTFFAAVSYFYPESVDPSLKPSDIPQEALLDEYTFVVVGAGAAGHCSIYNNYYYIYFIYH